MTEWTGEGTVISRRRHGETAAIISVLSVDMGVISGLVPGGAGSRKGPVLQPGNRLALRWRARLDDQLGSISADLVQSRAGLWADADALAGLNAVTALIGWALPQRDPHPRLAVATEALLEEMPAPGWPETYARWELLLLDELGFGLALDRCALSGAAEGLDYVSPRTGHAVTARAAGDWVGRLLPIPPLFGGAAQGRNDPGVEQALALTGHFLHTRIAQELVGRALPAARARLVDRLTRYRLAR